MKQIKTEEKNILDARRDIVAQLTAARLRAGMTQAELARRIGTQRSNICRLESGAQNPTLDLLLRVSEALGMQASFSLSEKQEEPMEECYVLKLYDEPLVRFGLKDGGLSGLQADLKWMAEDRKDVFPIGLELTPAGMVRWLGSRVIPKNRQFVEEILETFGLNPNDTKGIIDVCKGLSLNDSYWIVKEDFDGKFADYNLYQNRFSEILSLVAYTGTEQSHGKFTTSPEFTTGGMLPKAWRYLPGDGIYLYKGGNRVLTYGGNEPYSEYYAWQIAERMELHAVPYDLEMWKGMLASKCPLFCSVDVSYVPIWRLIPEITIEKCRAWYEGQGKVFSDEFRDMLVFDALIYNEDRHFGNFGVLRDNRTGKILSPAPLFDHGHSLFSQAAPEKFKNLEPYAKTLTPAYDGITFENLVLAVIQPRQIRKLRAMVNFSFRRHPNYNLPEDRLCAIEKQLRERAIQLLALAKSRKKPKAEADAWEDNLPPYLQKSLHDMKASWEIVDGGKKDDMWDVYWCDLNASINSAEVDREITHEQADALRKQYLRMKSPKDRDER